MRPPVRDHSGGNCLMVATALLLVGYLYGCASMSASIDPRAFEKYRDAFSEVQSSADAVLSVTHEWTYKNFLRRSKAKADDPATIMNLLLIFPKETYYLWDLPSEELYIKILRFQQGFKILNAAFASYTALLVQLSSGSLVHVTTLDGLVKEVNEDALAALRALGRGDEEEQIAIKGFAIFSIAAAEAARLYIEKGRRDYLIRVITENQKNIDLIAVISATVTKLVAIDIKAEYSNQIRLLILRWSLETGENRVRIVEELIGVNSEVTRLFEILGPLGQAYILFARKHRELGELLTSGRLNGFDVADFLSISRRLSSLYKELADKQADVSEKRLEQGK